LQLNGEGEKAEATVFQEFYDNNKVFLWLLLLSISHISATVAQWSEWAI